MSQIGFETGWLKERFQFDNAARNQLVEQSFLDFVKAKQKITIVDIGSGTGANCLYFIEKLEKDQQWFLIERDARFFKPAFQRLAEFADTIGYDFQIEGKVLKIEIEKKKVNINFVNDSFFRLPDLVDLKKADVVMAAAVFDLLSENQFTALSDSIFSNEIVLLTTMNYFGMCLQPESELDQKFIALYESHMNRQQDFGRSMGKNVNACTEKYFTKKDYNFIKGKSTWQIPPEALQMHNYLLGFMENSISEMLSGVDETAVFKQWLSEKRALSQNQRLSIKVEHFDFFISSR
jgi:SAM-dependent methyltransferase